MALPLTGTGDSFHERSLNVYGSVRAALLEYFVQFILSRCSVTVYLPFCHFHWVYYLLWSLWAWLKVKSAAPRRHLVIYGSLHTMKINFTENLVNMMGVTQLLRQSVSK